MLGDDVRIDGYGLTGRLGGAIEITEKPGEPTVATGELRVVEGVYEAYGQQLEIETGRVVFAGGPITEPGVDIRAVRRPAEGIVVGARVRGRLAAPELSLFSEPPMPQQEQLSYLVLGRPLDDASASESSAMSSAALALGLRGGNFVSERINKNLGLDSFGIETDPSEAAVRSGVRHRQVPDAEPVRELRNRIVRARQHGEASLRVFETVAARDRVVVGSERRRSDLQHRAREMNSVSTSAGTDAGSFGSTGNTSSRPFKWMSAVSFAPRVT